LTRADLYRAEKCFPCRVPHVRRHHELLFAPVEEERGPPDRSIPTFQSQHCRKQLGSRGGQDPAAELRAQGGARVVLAGEYTRVRKSLQPMPRSLGSYDMITLIE
jgi:hypothetical protein